jgi:hypothetical protein
MYLPLGSYPNSNRCIEPELLRIVVQNCRINDLISAQSDNQKLANGLKLIEPRPTTGSLAAYDNFESEELLQFKQIFCSELEVTITGIENFPGEFLNPIRNRVDLPEYLYKHLITYYNEVYSEDMNEVEFGSMAGLIEKGLQNSDSYIVVQPTINQSGRIRIAAEIFGSALAPRYKKNSHILAKFTQDNESTELYPGMVQFYFEHVLRLPDIGERTHRLAYVKWYLPTDNHRTRFYCRAENDDRSINIELWKHGEFYELSRDSIIPVHNIYCRFIPAKFSIGRSNNKRDYMAVIPINRKFHL